MWTRLNFIRGKNLNPTKNRLIIELNLMKMYHFRVSLTAKRKKNPIQFEAMKWHGPRIEFVCWLSHSILAVQSCPEWYVKCFFNDNLNYLYRWWSSTHFSISVDSDVLATVSIEINTATRIVVEIPFSWRFIWARRRMQKWQGHIVFRRHWENTMHIFLDMCFRLWKQITSTMK